VAIRVLFSLWSFGWCVQSEPTEEVRVVVGATRGARGVRWATRAPRSATLLAVWALGAARDEPRDGPDDREDEDEEHPDELGQAPHRIVVGLGAVHE
jgi:hypothetical protein